MLGGIWSRTPAVLGAVALLSMAIVAPAKAVEPSQVPPMTVEAGELVTLAELCAFRAPLALDGAGALPTACAPVVERLRRLRDVDPSCFERWLAEGAVPDCALPQK